MPTPANTLTFTLARHGSVPAGASITAGGAFTWTPTERPGPRHVHVHGASATASLRLRDDHVTVNEVNVAPVLAPIGNKTVNEGTRAHLHGDRDRCRRPANTLTFTLAAARCRPGGRRHHLGRGLHLDAERGPGPGTYTFTSSSPTASLPTRETITVTVNEVNVAPVLAPMGDKTGTGQLITFTPTRPTPTCRPTL